MPGGSLMPACPDFDTVLRDTGLLPRGKLEHERSNVRETWNSTSSYLSFGLGLVYFLVGLGLFYKPEAGNGSLLMAEEV